MGALLARARELPGLSAALLVGSVARHSEDRFSDVGLLVFVSPGPFPFAWSRSAELTIPLDPAETELKDQAPALLLTSPSRAIEHMFVS